MPRKGKHYFDLEDSYDDYDDDYYEDDNYDLDNYALPRYGDREEASSVNDQGWGQRSTHKLGLSNQQGGNMWQCCVCTFDNPEELKLCNICGVARDPSLIDSAPSSESSANDRSNLPGTSTLAKSLFAPFPRERLNSRIYQQLKNGLISAGTGKIHENIQELQKFLISDSHARSVEIVPFKFDSPSPDDIVAARQRGGMGKVNAKVPVSTGHSTSTSTSSLHVNDGLSTAQNYALKPLSGQRNAVPQKKRECDENGTSDSNLPLNCKQLSDGVKSMNINDNDRESVSQKGHKGKRLSLDTYEPDPWILEGLTKEKMQVLHLAIVGHVDAGKSTLMGRLLYLLGRVSQKEMHKYEREAKEKGKGSFAYAWVLDESSEERARGVTMTVAVAHFETPKFQVVLLDSPGHKDFVPNMISGASQADAAVLVVDASIGAFEAGFEGEGKAGGQTKEHTQLVRSFGVDQLVVAINKMDAVNYSKGRFNEVKNTLRPFLRHCGFKDSAITWVPVSATENQNLIMSPSEDRFKLWYLGPSLLEGINKFILPSREISKPLRVPIAEVRRTLTLGQATVNGKLEGGALKVGTKVLVMPTGDIAIVKGIEQDDRSVASARAGESVDIGLQGVEQSILAPGGVLCHPDYPVPVAHRLEVKVLILEAPVPILRGSQVVFHCHHAKEPAKITELIAILDQKTGAISRRKPRCLFAHQSAILEVVPERAVCVEEYSNYRALGRVSLRDAGKTLAVGIVFRIIENA